MQRTTFAVLLLSAAAVQGQAPPSTAAPPARGPAVAPATPPELTAEERKLRALFDPAADYIQSLDALPAAAMDAGPAAVPFLAGVLAGDVGERGERGEKAALGLAYIGGPEAVDALWRHQKTGRAPDVASPLAKALASVPLSAENRAFLEGCLTEERIGGDWGHIVSAALSLGVLRAAESRGTLERAAGPTGTITAGAAREALRWLDRGSWEVALHAEIEAPLQAVLRHGVSESDKAAGFYDPDRQLFWVEKDGTWTTASAKDGPGEAPTLSFRVHTSPDGERALVSVGLVFGPLAGEGYDYVLRKEGSGWVVQGVFFTWIS